LSSKAKPYFQQNKNQYRDYAKDAYISRLGRDKPVAGKIIDGTAWIDAAAEVFTEMLSIPGERKIESGLPRIRGNRTLLNLTVHDKNHKILARVELSFTPAERNTYAVISITATGYPNLQRLVDMGVHSPGEPYPGTFDNLYFGVGNTSTQVVALSIQAAETIEQHWPDLTKNAAF